MDNLTTTAVNKGTPVYVQIRPVGFSNVTYDRWEIEYTATPADYHYPLDEAVAKTERYTFNKGEAHTLVGTYVYTVYKLTLYNGESIATEHYYTEPAYVHTVIIRDGGLIGLGDIARIAGRKASSVSPSSCSTRTISSNTPSASPTKRSRPASGIRTTRT